MCSDCCKTIMKLLRNWISLLFFYPLSSRVSCIQNTHKLSMYFTDPSSFSLTGAVAEAFSVSGIEFVLAGVSFAMCGILVLPSLFNRCRYRRSENHACIEKESSDNERQALLPKKGSHDNTDDEIMKNSYTSEIWTMLVWIQHRSFPHRFELPCPSCLRWHVTINHLSSDHETVCKLWFRLSQLDIICMYCENTYSKNRNACILFQAF